MKITITVDVAPEEVPMATELLAVLRWGFGILKVV
jgi:hypothetical protein